MRNVLRYLTASILLGLACWSRANAQCTFDVGGASYDLSALQALSLYVQSLIRPRFTLSFQGPTPLAGLKVWLAPKASTHITCPCARTL